MYADDLALISPGRRKLYKLLEDLKEYLLINELSLNINKSKIMIFARKKQKSHSIPILWNDKPFEIVNSWKYLGLNLNRLPNKTDHLKKIKMTTNWKQAKVIGLCSAKQLNKYSIHKKIYNAFVKSLITYALPTWGWATKMLAEIDITQNKYFRRLFLLPMTIPAYLIQREFNIRPIKHDLIKHTFKFWKKISFNQKPKHTWVELKFWLKCPEQQHNPLHNFFKECIPQQDIVNTDLSELSLEQIN